MWYEVILTRNKGIVVLEFRTYDEVLKLFNMLRDAMLDGVYFVCRDTSTNTILIDRLVMLDS